MSDEPLEPVRGRGHVQWNLGAWAGALLGSTLWMLLSAGVQLATGDLMGLGALACFAVANAVGVWLWRCRFRLAPYPAMLLLLGTIGVAAVVAVAFLTHAVEDASRFYRSLLILPLVAGYLHVLERSARRRRSAADAE